MAIVRFTWRWYVWPKVGLCVIRWLTDKETSVPWMEIAPAAMRYTEARLMKVTEDTLVDLDKDTVDMIPNFDESLKEPSVLPTRIPLLLVNGASGIAVGMATNMPPHNLRDTIDAICAYIDDPI